MSTAGWIDEASAAFESALIELVGEHRPQLDAVEAGRRAALKAIAGACGAMQSDRSIRPKA